MPIFYGGMSAPVGAAVATAKKDYIRTLASELHQEGYHPLSRSIKHIFLGGREEELLHERLESKGFFRKIAERIVFTYNPFEEFWKMPETDIRTVYERIKDDLRRSHGDANAFMSMWVRGDTSGLDGIAISHLLEDIKGTKPESKMNYLFKPPKHKQKTLDNPDYV